MGFQRKTEESPVVQTENKAALSHSNSFQSLGRSRIAGADKRPYRSRGCLSANQHLQDQRLQDTEDAGSPGLCGAGSKWPISAGVAPPPPAVLFCPSECGGAIRLEE